MGIPGVVSDVKAQFADLISKAELPKKHKKLKKKLRKIELGEGSEPYEENGKLFVNMNAEELALNAVAKKAAKLAEENTLAFVHGKLSPVMDAFLTLYVSRTTNGEGAEVAAALEAVRLAFDACGLLMTDMVATAPDAPASSQEETTPSVKAPTTVKKRDHKAERARRKAAKEAAARE